MDTQQLRFHVAKEDLVALDKLSEGMLSRQQVASLVLRRALAALRDNPDKFKLFPQFDLSPAVMNDAAPPYKTKGGKK